MNWRKRATNKQEARRIAQWFQKRLRIQDWRIQLFIQNEPPVWASFECPPEITARVLAETSFKKARIWVSPSRSEAPRQDLFHELLHVVEKDIGMPKPTDHVEFAWNQLAEVCEIAYLAERKKVEEEGNE